MKEKGIQGPRWSRTWWHKSLITAAWEDKAEGMYEALDSIYTTAQNARPQDPKLKRIL